MKAVVVYESLWGNTSAVARSIAEGIGQSAVAIPTDEATPEVLADADLVVAGAPVLAFRLPTQGMLDRVGADEAGSANPPDLGHPPMRAWLEGLPPGHARYASFETRLRFSPGGATGSIDEGLERAGYERLAKPRKFIVSGKYGPLREGELDRARNWGAELAKAMA